jgi:hypothetical protein
VSAVSNHQARTIAASIETRASDGGETRRCFPIACRQTASRLQADDIGAHRQQNCDAYSDNDQEEFSHRSALSNDPNAKQPE